MACGHTGRTQAALPLAGAETAVSLAGLPHLGAEQAGWRQEATAAAERIGLRPIAGLHPVAGICACAADSASPGGRHV